MLSWRMRVLLVAFLGFFADRLYQRLVHRALAWRD